MTDIETIFNRETTVIIDTDSEDSGIISAAATGVVDPDDTFSIAFDQILNVMIIAVESMDGEIKEIAIDADAFFVMSAALAGEEYEETQGEVE